MTFMTVEDSNPPVEREWTDPGEVTIATLGSHSARQILKGAKDEGFRTLVVLTPDRESFYAQYGHFIDDIVVVGSYDEIPDLEDELNSRNTVIIPTGSTVAYLGKQYSQEMGVPNFGNNEVLDWEADRRKQKRWFDEAGIRMPKQFNHPDEVDIYPVIVKSHGAAGGAGYFLAGNIEQLHNGLVQAGWDNYAIQQYIIGVNYYPHYFYSPIRERVEIIGADIRRETNADGIGRVPAIQQQAFQPETSFVVVGNIGTVARESLMPEVQRMGEQYVEASRRLMGERGIYGPFCIEMVINADQKMYAIEASCRIVAGTNIFPEGSADSVYLWDEPMSMGRRIARELKDAMTQGRLDEVLD